MAIRRTHPRFRNPIPTVDIIIEIRNARGREGIVLIERKNPPPGWALPGGFVDYGEKLEDCVVREVLEETGLKTKVVGLVGVYSAPGRDPRGHFVTAVYELRQTGGSLKAGDDASSAAWVPVDEVPDMAFDHGDIIAAFLRSKGKDEEK